MLATVPVHPRATIVSEDLIRAYQKEIDKVRASHTDACTAISAYWWSLHVIRRDNLWRAVYDQEGGFTDWLADVGREPWGPGKSDFYEIEGAISRFQKLGFTETEVKEKLGHLTTALKGDLKELFDKGGKGDLLPQAMAEIEAGGETPQEFVNRVGSLGPDEQRKEVRGLLEQESVYATDSWEYDEVRGKLMFNVNWESKADGLIMTGTIVVSFTETTEPKRGKTPGYLPEKISKFIEKKIGLH